MNTQIPQGPCVTAKDAGTSSTQPKTIAPEKPAIRQKDQDFTERN